jgi:RNA polymerase sigma factor (sigma-70 family)
LHLLAPFSKPKTHEELFLEHYGKLVEWALQVTQRRHDEANDLVHDLYVQLIRTRPEIDLSDDDRVRGYLYTMLRNLSVSRARRAGRDALSSLQIVDYESVEYGLACIDRSKLILVRSALVHVCEYACVRRNTSRSASVLILRFFLGYYPSEIARILEVTRAAVEKHLQAAREEARVYLERPGMLRFMGQAATLPPMASCFLPDDPMALVAELRHRIRSGVKGECPVEASFEERYTQPRPGMGTAELAHVVSCERCLEFTNAALGLPTLADRFPGDTIHRDGDGNDPPNPPLSGPDPTVLKMKVRQAYEHLPLKLQIAVDGEILAAQRVSSTRNELQVKLEPLAKPTFLEVLSEQGIRMAYLQIEDPQVDPQPYVATTELSDGRLVELKFGLVDGVPVISVFYYDPLQEEIRAGNANPFVSMKGREEGSSGGYPSGPRSVAHAIRRFFHTCFPSLDSLWPLGIVTALATMLAVGLCLWTRKENPAMPSAASLLAESRQIEEAKIAGGGAIHATFALETRSQDGKLLETQKVDSWRSLKPDRSALRLTDGEGRIVAGRWRDASGKTTTYAKGRGLRSGDIPPAAVVDLNNAWEMVPGKEALSALDSIGDQPTLKKVDDGYDIEYERGRVRPNAGILRASLVLDRATLRPVSETVAIESRNSVREYRFQRLTYEVVPGNDVRDSDFAPDASLASLYSGVAARPDVVNRTAHLAIQALQLLNNLGPEIESFVDLDRLPDGSVQIVGVLPTQEQRAAIVHIFQSLHSEGQLKLALHAGDEPAEAKVQRTTITVESLEPVAVDSERIPLDAEIRSALSTRGLSGVALDERINQVASDALKHAARMHREAWTVSQIAADDFSADEIRGMQPEDQRLWLTLLDEHIRSLSREVSFLDADLTPLVHDSIARVPAAPSASPPFQSFTELSAAAKAMDRDGERLDRLLTAGLTLSASSLPTNHNVAEISELLADLRIEESMLHATMERLQTAAPTERTE